MASTLIFVTAATGNYASYIDWKRHAPAGEEHAAWYYDVDKVGCWSATVGHGRCKMVHHRHQEGRLCTKR